MRKYEKMNKQTKNEIKQKVTEIVGSLREKYGDTSSIQGLRRIVDEELKIPCKEFSAFDLFSSFCAFESDRRTPKAISYAGFLPPVKRYNLAHEVGHAFTGAEGTIEENERKADEFATQITGIDKWKVNLCSIGDGIIAVLFFPKTIYELWKGEHRNYYCSL